uniref:Uncharacterized protein n=1 Tax=Rhizophora mucronata TaxID=61149 RepID=A0A2P2Q1G3_RHIMU
MIRKIRHFIAYYDVKAITILAP